MKYSGQIVGIIIMNDGICRLPIVFPTSELGSGGLTTEGVRTEQYSDDCADSSYLRVHGCCFLYQNESPLTPKGEQIRSIQKLMLKF